MDGLEAEYGDRVAFLRLDAAHEGRAAFLAYELRGHPSYVILDTQGRVLWSLVGRHPASRLAVAIEQALGEE